MRLLPPIAFLFAAASKRPGTSWYLDANNIIGYKGTPRDSEFIADKLRQIEGAERVVLVYDGREGSELHVATEGFFQIVSLGEGMSADDFIEDQAKNAADDARVQVVTADRALSRRVLEHKPAVKKVINPLTFWKRYLPRLCGYKKPKDVQDV